MFAQYFQYYAIILRGGAFFRGHTVLPTTVVYHTYLKQESTSWNNTDVKFDYLKYMMLI